MNTLLGLKINKETRTIKVQEFELNQDGLTEIKAPAGSGKTTIAQLSLANPKELKKNIEIDAALNIERQLTYQGQKIFIGVTKKANEPEIKTVVYIKDNNGKIVKNPVIGGVKMTPAEFLKLLETELTLGVDKFLSSDNTTHRTFMVGSSQSGKVTKGVYTDQLSSVGIILDEKSENFPGSILDRLQRAKMKQSECYFKKRTLNGFKTALEDEGYTEVNMPEYVDLEIIKKQIQEKELLKTNELSLISDLNNKATKDWYERKSNFYTDKTNKVAALANEVATHMSVITSYNSGLETQDELRKSNLAAKIQGANKLIEDETARRLNISECISKLQDLGVPEVSLKETISYISNLEPLKEKRDFNAEVAVLNPLAKVPFSPEGKPIAGGSYTKEVDNALSEITRLRGLVAPIYKSTFTEEEPKPQNSSDNVVKIEDEIKELENKVANATETNKIAERWIAFKEWQRAQKETLEVQAEYNNMLTSLDLGIEGMKLKLIKTGKDKEGNDLHTITTVYNGAYDTNLFSNQNKEYRELKAYSETQKTVIAILMQAYLLRRKRESGHPGLDMMWIESPLDNRVRGVLMRLQDEFKMKLICNTTDDTEAVKEGQMTIENGILILK